MMKTIELNLEDEESVIQHLIKDHDLASDPEWSEEELREVGGPAESDLHFWYHHPDNAGSVIEPDHDHDDSFTKWLEYYYS